MRDWANRLGPRKQQIIQRLLKNVVQNHENMWIPADGEVWAPDSHWFPGTQGQQGHGQNLFFIM